MSINYHLFDFSASGFLTMSSPPVSPLPTYSRSRSRRDSRSRSQDRAYERDRRHKQSGSREKTYKRSRSRERNRRRSESSERRHRRSRSRNRRARSRGYSGAVTTAVVREFIDHKSCIVELEKSLDAAYLHEAAVFMANPMGNPYGPAVPITHAQQKASNLANVLQKGVDYNCKTIPVKSKHDKYVQYIVWALWPKTAEVPVGIPSDLEVTAQFQNWADLLDPKKLVKADLFDIRTVPKYRDATATISEIRSDEFGFIKLQFSDFISTNCLFHKDDVFHKDGIGTRDHPYFRDKSLAEMASYTYEIFNASIFRIKINNIIINNTN